MAENWLITGGCGFIGTSLIRSLGSRGHRIRVLDNLSVGTEADLARVAPKVKRSGQPSDWNDTVELIVGDVRDSEIVASATRGADVVVHLAAQSGVAPSVSDPRNDLMVNVVGTFNGLEAARNSGVRRFIYASSGAALGEVDPPLREDILPRPISPYGVSKLTTEYYASCYTCTFGLETVGLRFGNVYGPGSGHKNSVVAKFIRRAMNGQVLEIYGDGAQTRDFIFMEDLLDAITRSAAAPEVGGHVFQIATSQETTVDELTDKLVAILRERGVAGVTVNHVGERAGDVQRNYADTSKAGRMLGWSAATSLDEGLRETVNWFLRDYSAGSNQSAGSN